MTKKINEREWVKKYKQHVQDENLLDIINIPDLPKTQNGPWSFLKLAFLWSYAHDIYATIAGKHYKNICYVDLFSGSGIVSYKDATNEEHLLVGSPILMSTLETTHPFKKCFFFENNNSEALSKRLDYLNDNGKLSCTNCKISSEDCNSGVDDLIQELKRMERTHFLLFVDPFSTEINWSTMEKFLTLKYPSFDMIFNFQPFGVNRKKTKAKIMANFFGDDSYITCLDVSDVENKLDILREHYIKKLMQYENNVKTVHTIRVRSGKGGFYYDLLYTTRKEDPGWEPGINHLARKIERISGKDVEIILDPKQKTLSDLF